MVYMAGGAMLSPAFGTPSKKLGILEKTLPGARKSY
jgi:hypothetical protein